MLALLAGSAWAAADQSGDRNVFSRIPDGKGFTQVAAKAAPMGVSTAWVDDGYTSATTGWGVDRFATINGAVQAINAGGTINVFPGSYIEAAVNSYLYDGVGPYTFGLFLAADGVTVQGVDAAGMPITSYAGVVANVQCNATNSFGASGVFIQGSNVTVSGLNLFLNPINVNKTIEVIGDAATIKYCRLTDGGSLYINDFRYDAVADTSLVKSYTVLGNQFTYGTSLDIASGGGFSGPVAGRQVLNNSFEMDGAIWNAISFNGSGTGVEWFVYGVGGAVITGNSFSGGNGQYIRARGDYDNSQFDWGSYFANNTFDHAVVAGANPPADLREYSYTSGSYVFNHCRRIGTSIQAEIGTAAAGDIVMVAAGTYNEGLTIGKNVTILGPNAALSPNAAGQVAPAVLAPLGNTHAILGTAAGMSVAVKGMNFDLTGTNNNYRFVELINQASNTWTFEHNVFANARDCVNGNWYLTGTLGDLYFNLLDNLFTGSIVSNGIALWGTGVHHVDIRDNVFRDNQGWALNVNNVHGTISNNLFTDTAITGPNWYDDQSGMIVASANNNLVVSGNTFSNLGSIGISIYDGFDGVLTGTGNSFTGCATAGVRVRPGALDLSDVAFSGNTFNGSAQGVLNSTSMMLNAINNSWGNASGPANAVLNPTGTGAPVSNGVLFTPWVGRTTSVLARIATPTGPFFLEGTPAIGVDGDGAAGFGTGSIKAPNAYTRYVLDPEVVFGRPVTVGEIYRISYLTKKGTLHTADASDWFLYMYTDPYVGGHSSWYGNRIGSEPYFSQNLVDTAGAWNQWTTDAGANNRLRFFDSSPPANYFGSYTDGFLSDISNNPTYTSQTILMMGLSVGTAWAAGFNGQLDGLVIELNSGQTLKVNFESGNAVVAMTPATSGPINCSQSQTLTVNMTKTDGMPDVFGFNAVVRATGPVNWGTISSLAPFGGTTQFLTFNQGDGSYMISGTTVGSPTQPITAVGTTPLFTIQYVATNTGTANISFDSFSLRDPNNAPIPSLMSGATIAVDCTAPAAVTAITAAPGHNKVAVGWTHTGVDVANYEVYRGLWTNGTIGVSAYPEYDDLVGNVIPARQATRALVAAGPAWVLAGTVPAGTTTFTDTWATAANRGVYYYEVFAVDAANNPSGPAAAIKRATNYWLGDVDGTAGNLVPNGLVNVYDMTVLGTYFGNASVALNSAASPVDVGPTDNFSRLGIPDTDSKINFEDLMIFAMNFGVVTAAKSDAIVGTSVDLAWVRYDDGSMALRLVDGAGLKGVRVTANKPVGALVAGGLLDEQSELTFVQNIGETLDANVAVMGVNTTFTGTGDLFVIPAGEAIELSDLTITARAIDNSKMEVKLTSAAGGQATPRAFALNGNYPNPFNPMTKISFSLPETQHVRLTVYGLDGRKVATLLDETRGAGLHEIVWTGRDDAGQSVASGTYFYRVDAGPYSDVRKMTLMK
jgi:hypothetical protein